MFIKEVLFLSFLVFVVKNDCLTEAQMKTIGFELKKADSTTAQGSGPCTDYYKKISATACVDTATIASNFKESKTKAAKNLSKLRIANSYTNNTYNSRSGLVTKILGLAGISEEEFKNSKVADLISKIKAKLPTINLTKVEKILNKFKSDKGSKLKENFTKNKEKFSLPEVEKCDKAMNELNKGAFCHLTSSKASEAIVADASGNITSLKVQDKAAEDIISNCTTFFEAICEILKATDNTEKPALCDKIDKYTACKATPSSCDASLKSDILAEIQFTGGTKTGAKFNATKAKELKDKISKDLPSISLLAEATSTGTYKGDSSGYNSSDASAGAGSELSSDSSMSEVNAEVETELGISFAFKASMLLLSIVSLMITLSK